MKLLFDFFPIIAFFIAYKCSGIYAATFIAILASLIQVLWLRFKNGKFEKIPLLTFGMMLLLGGATLFLQNELFIKWKPTVLYWTMAGVFLGSHFVGQRIPIMKRLAGETLPLSAHHWKRLNLSWVLFFMIMGCLNLYVVHYFDTNTWVNFKLFGTLGLTLVFILLQGVYLYKNRLPEISDK